MSNKLHKFYTLEGETFDEALQRLAYTYAHNDPDEGLESRILGYSRRGWFMYSSPQFNAPEIGKPWGKAMPIACFGGYVDDTVSGLCDHTNEVRNMSVAGGGVGGYWGHVRSVDDKSPGAIPFLHTIDSDVIAYKQGKTRRAAYAAYMDVTHPDIIEFLQMRLPGRDINRTNHNLHHGVCINDDFIRAVDNDDVIDLVDPNDASVRNTVKARYLWELILETRYRTGEPYIFNKDQANRKLHPSLKSKGYQIHSSNLCVAPETTLLTSKGQIPIRELEDQWIDIWNGTEWSNVHVVKTGTNQSLITVTTADGYSIDCTPYHKFYVGGVGQTPIVKRAHELRVGDKLIRVNEDGDGGILHSSTWVAGVENKGRSDDTYCVHEPKRNAVVFNGILTGNCSEIMLPISTGRSFVCCLASVNLEHYDEWKDTTMVADLITMLNNVLDIFIKNAPPALEWAVATARDERNLGLGAMGWHSYLQKHRIPINSKEAFRVNSAMFQKIAEDAIIQSKKMTYTLGHFPDGKEGDAYNAHLLAIAPNANSAILAGTSPGVEPWMSNYYTQVTRGGGIVHRNKFLDRDLEECGRNTIEVWDIIKQDGGSIQNVPNLPEWMYEVYKTVYELEQIHLVNLARDRQQYLCQAQSLNLFFPAGSNKEYVNAVHRLAFSEDNPIGDPLKSLYYLRTQAGEKSEYVSNKIVCVGCD